jgi:hypothetical protein
MQSQLPISLVSVNTSHRYKHRRHPVRFGIICPLTTIEMTLRSRGGGAVYPGSFISHWLETLLYYQLPAWVFVVCYMIFGVIVAASWFWIRPRRFR